MSMPARAVIVAVVKSAKDVNLCTAEGAVQREDWPTGWVPRYPPDRASDAQVLVCRHFAGHEGPHFDPYDLVMWQHTPAVPGEGVIQ